LPAHLFFFGVVRRQGFPFFFVLSVVCEFLEARGHAETIIWNEVHLSTVPWSAVISSKRNADVLHMSLLQREEQVCETLDILYRFIEVNKHPPQTSVVWESFTRWDRAA
jgi:hypothetical protein